MSFFQEALDFGKLVYDGFAKYDMAWPLWFYQASAIGYYLSTYLSFFVLVLTALVALTGGHSWVPAKAAARVCAVGLIVNQLTDLGNHMPEPAHWPHTVTNIINVAAGLQMAIAPMWGSDVSIVARHGVLAVVYVEMMQIANIWWIFGGLCNQPKDQVATYDFWSGPLTGMQGPVLVYLAGMAYWPLYVPKDSGTPGLY